MNTAKIIPCPHCQGPLEVPPELAGQEVLCPHCSRQLTLPGPSPQAIPRATPVQPAPANLDSDAYQDDDFGLAPATYQQYQGLLPPAAPATNIPRAQAANPTPAINPGPSAELLKEIEKRKRKQARKDEIEFDSPMLQKQVEDAKREARLQRSTGSDGGWLGNIIGYVMAAVVLGGGGWMLLMLLPSLGSLVGAPEGFINERVAFYREQTETLAKVRDAATARKYGPQLVSGVKDAVDASKRYLHLADDKFSEARIRAIQSQVKNDLEPVQREFLAEVTRIQNLGQDVRNALQIYITELDRAQRELESLSRKAKNKDSPVFTL